MWVSVWGVFWLIVCPAIALPGKGLSLRLFILSAVPASNFLVRLCRLRLSVLGSLYGRFVVLFYHAVPLGMARGTILGLSGALTMT